MHDYASKTIGGSAEECESWLKQLAHELGSEDHQEAWRVLLGTLRTLRESLPPEELAALGEQLPVLIRGLYYEGWDPAAEVHGLEDVDGFLRRLALAADLGGETEASLALAAVLRLLVARTSLSASGGALSHLPGRLGALVSA
ncbi:MAG TPA: DUF2267 domain-containing protein [Solirubrobacteraceae bacterium]|nr:DUF2267 domain-containing protein [Solirubrobacteraceae bacterium]